MTARSRSQPSSARRLSLALGSVGAITGAVAWKAAAGGAPHDALQHLALPIAPLVLSIAAGAALGSATSLAIVGRIATRRAARARGLWLALAERLEALAEGDLVGPIPVIDGGGPPGRLARAVFLLGERLRGIDEVRVLERARAEDARQLSQRLQATAEGERRQLFVMLASMFAQRRAPVPTVVWDESTLLAEPANDQPPAQDDRGSVQPPSASANWPEEGAPELRGLLGRLGRL